jgi:hypothetical protein
MGFVKFGCGDNNYDARDTLPVVDTQEKKEKPMSSEATSRPASKVITEVCIDLERLFDSDAYDSIFGLTPRAQKDIGTVLSRYGYKLEKVKK